MRQHCILLFAIVCLFGSCASVPVVSKTNSSWAVGKQGYTDPVWRGTIRVISVAADKSGAWTSVENETRDMLPLLLSEKAFLVVSSSSFSDYCAEVKVREREYPDRWQTKRSLSAEVRIWKTSAQGDAQGSVDEPLPLSAGRSLSEGTHSFASSKVLSFMLRRAVRNAVRGLPANGGESLGNKEGK